MTGSKPHLHPIHDYIQVLADQEFRHTLQEDSEKVADFVRRLEKTFRIAYGSDHFSQETREAFLHSQLRSGLTQGLIQNPAVSGALTYNMAACNEEKRKKKREYQSTYHGSNSRDQRMIGPCMDIDHKQEY